MDIPPEVIAAKEAIEDALLQAGLITGIDFGVRDEEAPKAEDLALRIFVADRNNVPPEVLAAVSTFPFPVVVLQRYFGLSAYTKRHRPVVGGVSVSWAFPETAFAGTTDAAICTIDVDWEARIEDIGFSRGSRSAELMRIVTKRGRTSGRTFGWISGLHGSIGTAGECVASAGLLRMYRTANGFLNPSMKHCPAFHVDAVHKACAGHAHPVPRR